MKKNIFLLAVFLLISSISCDHGVKTARHAYSASSSGSNSYASSGSYSGSAGSSGSAGGFGSAAGNPAFWWAGPNSPFKEASEYFYRCSQKGDCGNIPGPFAGVPANLPNNLPAGNGCNDNGCSFSGGYNIHDKQQTGGGATIDRSKNPFLNGDFQGVAISSCSGSACPGGKPQSTITTTHCKGSDCKTNTQHGQPGGTFNLGQNPFLNGGAAGAAGTGCAGVKGGCKGGQGTTTFEHSYNGQFGNQGPSGTSCGPSGCNVPSGSFAGSGSYAGSGSQASPGFIGGCAGTQGGCKPGQTGGPSSGGQYGSTSGSFSGSGGQTIGSGTTYTSFPNQGPQSGCSGTKGGCTGQTTGTGSFSGSTSGSFPNQGQPGYPGFGSGPQSGTSGTHTSFPNQGQPSYQSGCAGTKGGCTGQTTGSTSGAGTTFTNQGQSDYPGFGSGPQSSQTIGSGSFSGSTSGSGTTHTSFANQGQPNYGCAGAAGGCTGQTTGSGSFSGSASGSGTTHTSFPNQGQPGNPNFGCAGTAGGCTGQTTGSGSFSGSGTTQGQIGGCSSTKGGCKPGQYPGTTSGTTTGTYNQPSYTSGSQNTGGYGGSTTSFAGTGGYGGKSTPSGGAPEKCYGDGLLCVEKHLCSNGILNTNGDGLLNIRDGNHYCDVKTETCCKLPNKSGRPFEDRPVSVPFPGSTTFHQTTNSHHSSSAASSSSSSSSSSFGSNTNFGNRYTPALQEYGPGQAPEMRTTPGLREYGPGQAPGLRTTPGLQEYGPGQAPGLRTTSGLQEYGPGQAPEMRTTPGLQEYGPGQAPGLRTTPGLQEYGPGQAPGLRTTPKAYNGPGLVRPQSGLRTTTVLQQFGPGKVDIRPHGQNDLFDSTSAGSETNEYNFPSTLKGPAYLPPGPSPSPSSYTPDLLPPPSSPRPYYPAPTTPKPYYPPPTTQRTTPAYLPPRYSPTTKKPQTTNGYLPPQQPSATVGDNQYLPPPQDPQRENQPDSNIINISVIPPDRIPDGTNGDPSILRPTSPRPTQNPRTDFPQNTTPYPGCAAALKCVPGDFCTADGTISKARVILTPEQEANRVPTTECSDPESGIIGKCCRDPDYKDPWPSTQLGLFNPDQAGQGSSPAAFGRKPAQGVKGGRRPYEPNQIGAPSNNPNTFVRPGYPTIVPNVPFDSRQVSVPQQVDFKPPVENRYDASSKFPQSVAKNPESCGVRHPGGQPRGSGPIDASFAEIPWQAMILRDTNRSLLCGGAIIRRDVILTTAHCVEGLRSDDVLVKGGEWKLGIDDEPKPFQINKVAAIVRHPGYNPQNKLNDVALLLLKEKFRLDKNVDTLCLPEPNEDVAQKFQKSKCITTGWGKTILQLHIQNSIMHIIGVGILPGSQCQQTLQQYHPESANLYNTNCVCGAPVQQQADICDVDIGSALACEGPDGRYTLAGIYSWDTGCNPTAQIAGYTKVDTQWVSQTLQRPIKDLKTEESGFYQQLAGQECHCLPGKK